MVAEDFLNERVVLITGGAGSLGSALVERLVSYPVKSIRILDNDENRLVWLEQKVKDDRLRLLLGDIKDAWRTRMAVDGVDMVIHCAALKHIELSMRNPFEYVSTNVVGLQQMINSTLEERNVERFLTISSDKSINPTSPYDATKLLQEFITVHAEKYKGDRKTLFSVARPPNYLKSSGSVIEKWEYQKSQGNPLTVTHNEMKRYFMPMEKIVDFVLGSLEKMKGGEIFVPADLIERSIYEMALEISDQIVFSGLREGEKLSQPLMTEIEVAKATRDKDVWIIR